MNYFKLLDSERNGTVVRAEGCDQQKYVPRRGWVDSGILLEYFNDESPLYNLYEEITKSEAQQLIGGDRL